MYRYTAKLSSFFFKLLSIDLLLIIAFTVVALVYKQADVKCDNKCRHNYYKVVAHLLYKK